MTSVALESQTVATEYNGWTNRETWLTNLWLNNDMGSYEQLQEICRKDCEVWEKAEELETQFQDQLEDMYDYPTFWSDIIGTALDRVDWYRIVEANMEDAR